MHGCSTQGLQGGILEIVFSKLLNKLLGSGRERRPPKSTFGSGVNRSREDRKRADDYEMQLAVEKERARRGMIG